MVLFIFSYLEQFQARTEDEDTKKWKKHIMGMLDTRVMYRDFFPEFFRGVFERLEKTMKQMEAFKGLPIYDNLKSRKD